MSDNGFAREGDSGFGSPPPAAVTTVSPDTLRPVREEAPIHDEPGLPDGFFLPDALTRVLRAALLLAALVTVFLLLTQTASLLADFERLAPPVKTALGIPLAAFGLVILLMAGKMLLLARRLRTSPQIRLRALQELAKRRELRERSLHDQEAAARELQTLLRTSYTDDFARLAAMGLAPEKVTALRKARKGLLEKAEALPGGYGGWLEDFRRNFQKPLDEFANARAQRYGFNAAVMAGLSPIALLDRMIVLAACLTMLKEELEIYALKPSWDKNLLLMAQVLVSTYLSGVINDLSESGADSLQAMADKVVEGIPDLAVRLGARTAGAATQGYMIYRLGKSAIRVLRPIADWKEDR